MSFKVEDLDDSQIEKSTILSIMSCTNESIIDKEISDRLNKEDIILAKKITLFLIGKKSHILGNRSISLISDREFLTSLMDGEINLERLKMMLKFEMDSRIPKENKDELKLKYNYLPYDKLKELYIKTKVEKEIMEQQFRQMDESQKDIDKFSSRGNSPSSFNMSRRISGSSPINIFMTSEFKDFEKRITHSEDKSKLYQIPIFTDKDLILLDTIMQDSLSESEKEKYKILLEDDKSLLIKKQKFNESVDLETILGIDQFIHRDKFLQVYNQTEEESGMSHQEFINKVIEHNSEILSNLIKTIAEYSNRIIESDKVIDSIDYSIEGDNSLNDYEKYIDMEKIKLNKYENQRSFNYLYKQLLSYENEKDFWNGDFQRIMIENGIIESL